ncbi:MAG: primosomal protein N' [Chloroflexota bacterium]|nr:primosomal protein N' [Chloroflexota bacterium]
MSERGVIERASAVTEGDAALDGAPSCAVAEAVFTVASVSVHAIIPEYWTEWTYAIPPELRGTVANGQLVWVPLREKVVLGIVVELGQEAAGPEIRPIHAVVEPTFCLTTRQLNLATWISERYCCSLFHAASLMMPPGVERRVIETYRLTDAGRRADHTLLTPTQRQIVEMLETHSDDTGASLTELRAALGGALTSVLAALRKRGLVAMDARIKQDRLPTRKRVPYVRAILGLEFEAPLTAPKQQTALDYLRRRARLETTTASHLPPGAVTVATFRTETGLSAPLLKRLQERGLVEMGTVANLPAPPDGGSMPAPVLTGAQQVAWDRVAEAMRDAAGTTFLLHGVTGSGKTEIYLRAVAASMRAGKGAIVCVPEIALATQMVKRILARFPGQVALLHSGMKDPERFANWERLRRGEATIAIGPRSALFAPIEKIGCIVLDEEHDAAYKQDALPRYHSRDVARELARMSGAVCILGSATPDLTTFAAAKRGRIGYLSLPDRVRPTTANGTDGTLQLPPVALVDMREERRNGNTGVFSGALVELLCQAHARNEQAILLLNRRGMATFSQCRSCGHVPTCPQCDVPLVYHADRERLRCHRCDFEMRPSVRCPKCGQSEVRTYGVGTQRVEDETRRLLPGARVVRWDQDSLRAEGGHESILRRMEAREIDVLVGTQMVAKGLDLPMVTVIGVVNGDTQLHLPDFRAAERTFQMLTQVAGRAGRRSPGRVVIQTQSADHPALVAAQQHDYILFARSELPNRQRLGFPPYGHLVRFVYKHRDEAKARAEADRLAFALARVAYRSGHDDVELIGPAPCFTAKIRGEFLWQVVAVGKDLTPLLRSFPVPYGWIVDVDPMSML